MGGQQSQPIQLEIGPGFQKRKANTFPGYESYDFGGYEIWGPYKKIKIPGPFGSSSWQPMNKTVDGALVLDSCNRSESLLKPQSNGSVSGTLLQSYSSFSTTPDVGSDKPACYQDNMGFSPEDDGLFYIHYKHPMFARIIRDSGMPRAGFSGLLPTLFQGKKINQAKTRKNVTNAIMQRPSGSLFDMSMQNIVETGVLAYKGQKAMNRLGSVALPRGIQGPLDQAVRIISTKTAIFNMGQKRTLNGGRRKHLRKSGTRKRR